MTSPTLHSSASVAVAIIGAGFSGIGAAAALKQQGIDDFVILERAAEVGGVWRDNRYPGCRCDVPSALYSFSYKPKPDWSDRFAAQPEIQQYLAACITDLGLTAHLRMRADVKTARWDESSQHWLLMLGDGATVTARMLVVGSGALNEPVIPRISGIESFEGETFHSAQWPSDFDPTGKRIGVIGTGASAVQLVPEIVDAAAHVTVFQRTAPWVVPRGDRAIPQWLRTTYSRIPGTMSVTRTAEYVRREMLTDTFTKNGRLLSVVERTGRHHIRAQVHDAKLRRLVTPKFRAGCKRIIMSDDWYPALQRNNVDLVVDPIDRFTADGIAVGLAAGNRQEHRFDAVVMATGFAVQRRSILFDIFGSDGRSIAHSMAATTPTAYLGSTIPGFPNLVLMTGPNTGLANNSMVVMIEAQAAYAASIARHLVDHPDRALDVRAQALANFTAEMEQRLAQSVWAAGGCSSWYLDAEGRVTALWPGRTSEFRRRTRELRLADYVVVPRVGGV